MKYTLIGFTFNKVRKEVFSEDSSKLQLRNHWEEQIKDEEHLFQQLDNLGFTPPYHFPNVNKVVKMSGNFKLPGTRIIIYIIKN